MCVLYNNSILANIKIHNIAEKLLQNSPFLFIFFVKHSSFLEQILQKDEPNLVQIAVDKNAILHITVLHFQIPRKFDDALGEMPRDAQTRRRRSLVDAECIFVV